VITIETRCILVIDDRPEILNYIELNLIKEGFEVLKAGTGEDGVNLAVNNRVDLVLTDLRLPDLDGVEVMRQIHQHIPQLPTIIMTGFGTIENAVDAMKQGAHDYLTKPMTIQDLTFRIHKALEFADLKGQVRHLKDALKDTHRFDRIIRASGMMDKLCRHAAQLATSDVTILIQGESGTGKELLAQAIHYSSPRDEAQLVPIDCATLTETLLENELFGHAKGAYTGAYGQHAGLLETANHGTVFLDEIGDMPLTTQAKLLRVLQERTFRPVGSTKNISIDVRVIVATNKNLNEAVRNNTFREDLYYRVSAATLVIPPLRDRTDDIPALARHFLQTCAESSGRLFTGFSTAAMHRLLAYPWPGNVRELFNKVKYATAIAKGAVIEADDLFASYDEAELKSFRSAKDEAVKIFERQYLNTLLRAHEGNVAEASETAGVNRTNLYALLRRNNIDPAVYKMNENGSAQE